MGERVIILQAIIPQHISRASCPTCLQNTFKIPDVDIVFVIPNSRQIFIIVAQVMILNMLIKAQSGNLHKVFYPLAIAYACVTPENPESSYFP